jgi:hypothetical protein
MAAVTRHFSAVVTREAPWWVIHVPEIDKTTQSRTLAAAADTARDLIALILDVDLDTVDVTLRVDVPGLDAAAQRLEDAEKLARAAREEELRARRDLAQLLARHGITMRDSGVILGLSHQRVAQLLGDGPRQVRGDQQAAVTG